MNILICADCGYRASRDWVAMADTCPSCDASPFNIASTGVYEYGIQTYFPDGD